MGVRRKKISNDKPLINEYDLTKLMLNKVREGIITEEKNDSIVLDGPELKQERDKFEEAIGVLGNIKGYGDLIVYPYDNNVVWSGDFHNGLRWAFSLREKTELEGVMTVDDQELELMDKIKRYGDSWTNEWAKKLRDDYKTQSDGGRQ